MVPQKKSCADYYLPIRDDIWYCLHGFQEMFLKQVPSHRRINLEVYSNTANQSDVQWGPVTFFNTHTQTLYQPWGTNLRAEEFYQPTFSHSPFVFWVGSIWNNTQNQGNLSAIAELRTVLKEHKLYFVPVRFIPNSFNTFLIRHSRIAPAIAGQFQVDVNYLPCRMFKNISYGQLGFSNVKKFADILGPATLPGNTLAEMVDHVLRLSKNEYITLVQEQQKQIKNYTYVDSFNNIKRAFDMLR